MSNAARRLADLTRSGRGQNRLRRVVKVNTDGTVDLDWGLDENLDPVIMDHIRCESGYPTRAVGDIVRVIVDDTNGPGWSVAAKI